jgi:hypothetical protein
MVRESSPKRWQRRVPRHYSVVTDYVGVRTPQGRRLTCLLAAQRQSSRHGSPRFSTDGCFGQGIVPVPAGISGREPRPAPATGRFQAAALPTQTATCGSGILGVPPPGLARLGQRLDSRPGRPCGRLATSGLEVVLGVGVQGQESRPSAYSKGGARAHPTDGAGEWLGSASDSRRTGEAGSGGRGADGVPLSAKGARLARPAPALVSLSTQSPGQPGRDGLLHRPDHHVQSVVAVCSAAPRTTADRALRGDRPSGGAVDHSATS